MAGLDNIRRIDEVFGKGAARDEASLVWVNQSWHKVLEARGQTFGDDLHAAVLERDGTVLVGPVGTHLFREQDNEGLIDRTEVNLQGMEVMKEGEEAGFHKVPVFFEEGWAETIWAWAGVTFHGQYRGPNFIEGEGLHELARLEGVERGGGHKGGEVKGYRAGGRGTQEIAKETSENKSFIRVSEKRGAVVRLNNFDLVLLEPGRRTKMEEAGIFVAEGT